MTVNRPQPSASPGYFKTYQIAAPAETHYRPGTCSEVGCPHWRFGWATEVDETSQLGQRQAWYIRRVSGRGFVETRTPAGLTRFEFEAGQQCFASDTHRVSLERPALFVVRDGDWRGNPRGTEPVFRKPEDWVDDFATHQGGLKDLQDRG